jgi:hypothetical protein
LLLSGRNRCDNVSRLGSSTSTFQTPLTLAMEVPNAKACLEQILRAAKIKILAPQKLIKECLSDVGFLPFLTTHGTMVMRFKRTLANLEEDTPGKASKVARQGVPGMVVVGGASLVESLRKSLKASVSFRLRLPR